LALVIKEAFDEMDAFETYQDGFNGAFVKLILEKAKTKSCNSRSILSSNEKMEKKVEKVILAGRNVTGIFAQLWILNRRKLHHKGLTIPKPGDNEWLNYKQAAKLASEFCNEFDLKPKEGMNEYIRLGLTKMKNVSVFKFTSLHSSICSTYESKKEIDSDHDPEITEEAYGVYGMLVARKIGEFSNNYKEIPEKYVCFKRAKEEAKKLNLSMSSYIEAQFWGMEFRSGIPDPYQLYGDKAVERAIKYCYEKNISLKPQKKIDFGKIKKHRDDSDSEDTPF
jgi:hypothetical protein